MNSKKDSIEYLIHFEGTTNSEFPISANSSIHRNISPYSLGDISLKNDNVGHKLVDLLISGNIGYRFPKELVPAINKYMDPKIILNNTSLLSNSR